MERLDLYDLGAGTVLRPPVVHEAKLPPYPDSSRNFITPQPLGKIGDMLELHHVHFNLHAQD
jgi:hypothetical protein